MKNKKYMLTIVLCLIFSMSCAIYADDTILKLKIEDVLANIEKTSLTMQVEKVKLNLAKHQATAAQNIYDSNDNSETEVAVMKADYAVIDAQRTYADALLKHKIKIGTMFNEAIQYKMEIEFAQVSLENAQNRLLEADIRLKNGVITKAIHSESEKKLLEAKKDLFNKKTAYDNKVLEIKKEAGLKAETAVEIVDYKQFFVPYAPTNISNIIDEALKVNFNIKKADRDLALAQAQYNVVRGTTADGTAEYSTLLEKKAIKKNIIFTEKLGYWTDYYALLNAQADVSIARLDLGIANINLTAAKNDLHMQKITKIKYSEIEIEYKKAVQKEITQVNKYMDMVTMFKNKLI